MSIRVIKELICDLCEDTYQNTSVDTAFSEGWIKIENHVSGEDLHICHKCFSRIKELK